MRVRRRGMRSGRQGGRELRAPERRRLKTAAMAAGIAAFCLAAAGCASMRGLTARTAPEPDEPWTPPPSASKGLPSSTSPVIPSELREAGRKWSLIDLVDIGLANSPETRAAWSAARAASAGIDIARAAYYPDLSAKVTGEKTKGSAVGGRFTFDYSSLDAGASLYWLLLDMGGRKAGVDAARQALDAANWTQNAVIQNVILLIEQNYYAYLASLALAEADRTSLKEAEASLDAAEARHRAGVATISDLLQAQTSVAEARLNLISDEGAADTFHGALAAALGLPANTAFELAEELPVSLPLGIVSGNVEAYLAEAQTRRPDLAAARAQVLEARAAVRSARSDGLPTLTANGSYDRIYFLHNPTPSNNLSFSLSLNIPVSVGIANLFRVLQARAQADAAQAQMDQTEKAVLLQVWTSYSALKTAAQRIVTAEDLDKTAAQSYKVSTESYKQGVQDILELLTAQSVLESARAGLIRARTDWLLALAQFAHDTGVLGRPAAAPAGALPIPPKKEERTP